MTRSGAILAACRFRGCSRRSSTSASTSPKSRILGHVHLTTTLDVYTHLFAEARRATELRAQLAGSSFADLLNTDDRTTTMRTAVR